jgi:hypothetical protein
VNTTGHCLSSMSRKSDAVMGDAEQGRKKRTSELAYRATEYRNDKEWNCSLEGNMI